MRTKTKNKVKHIYFFSNTSNQNQPSDQAPTSDWLVDISDDRCSTIYNKNLPIHNTVYIFFQSESSSYQVI